MNAHLLPQRPELPDWAQAQQGSPPPRIEGVVDSVQGLPDGRLRVLLREVRPADAPQAPPLLGITQWAWDRGDQNTVHPVEGQRVRLSLPLRDTVGFRNEGLEDMGEFWRARKVLWRLWSKGQSGQPEWIGEGHTLAKSRTIQRQTLVEALRSRNTGQTEGAEATRITQGEAFLPALLFGDRQYLSSRTVEHMAAASLVHSLALSGQHLALAALCGALLACGAGGLFPRVYLRVPRRKLMALCSLPPALLYVWLGGAPFSLLRAFIMLVVLALLLWRNQPRTLADLLITALVAITIAQPLAVFDTGLQLSVLCVASMALALPFLRRVLYHLEQSLWPPPLPSLTQAAIPHWQQTTHTALHMFLRWFLLAAGVSLAIQLVMAPLLLLRFGQISPWFPLNLLWLPVLGLWVLPLAAMGQCLLSLGLDTLAGILLSAAAWPCDLLLQGLEMLASHGLLAFPALLRPHWTALLGWGALMLALALLPSRWKELRQKTAPAHLTPPQSAPLRGALFQATLFRLTVAACLLLCIGPLLRLHATLFAPAYLEILDVGQGQALRLVLPGGHQLLIDGGGSLSPRFDPGKALVLPRISYNAAPRLHSVINSHPDADHWRGLRHILEALPVGRFYHNGDAYPAADAATLAATPAWAQGQPLHAGMVLPLPSLTGNYQLEVLHPPAQSTFTGNNNSLILRLTYNGRGLALLPGDAELPALHYLLASGQDVSAEVLVLPHHGSRRSLLPEFYDAVAPRLALASCGRYNRFGFPSLQVQDALHKRGVRLLSTSKLGGVVVDFMAHERK